jgi:hypothetical protein
MNPATHPGECPADEILVDWFAQYLMARDSIIYDDAGLVDAMEGFNTQIAELHTEYGAQLQAHGLLRPDPA